jgi:perosamine synthetase
MNRFPLARPYIGKKEEQAVLEVLHSGVLSIGPKIEAFEKRFARFVGVKHAIAVSSGTAGLHLALIAAGVKEGDEVITPPFSFVASANAILYVGGKPVFVDIDPRTYNIDPEKIERAITPKTKAMLVVHILGQCAAMDEIIAIAKKHKLKIIEDACESLGATYEGRGAREKMAGTFGESGVFAFYPNKQMTTGEGGMIVTNDKKRDALFRSLRNQGRGKNRNWLDHERLGYNYRLPEMSAAVGLAQLENIDFLIRERQRIARWYSARLAPYPELITTPYVALQNTHTYFVYTVLLPSGVSREKVMQSLKKKGIATKPYLPSIHLFSFYRERFGYRAGNFPVSEDVSKRVLALPFYIGLKKEDVAYISKKLLQVLS